MKWDAPRGHSCIPLHLTTLTRRHDSSKRTSKTSSGHFRSSPGISIDPSLGRLPHADLSLRYLCPSLSRDRQVAPPLLSVSSAPVVCLAVRENPVRCHSSQALQEWTCDVHNIVNRSLKKPTFNCSFLQARWGAVDCGPNGSCRVHYRDVQQSLRNAR